MTYQIPCNLHLALRFDLPAPLRLLGDGIEEVRRLTGAIDAMIDLEKAAEVAERIQRPLSAKEGGDGPHHTKLHVGDQVLD